MERKKSLLDDNTNKLDVWRKIISQTENQINWWCLFLTNHRWAALVNKVKKKNFRALEYALSFMEIEGKTLGLLLFCILPPQFLKRLLRRLFFYAKYLPQKRDEAQLQPWLSLTWSFLLTTDVETGQPISLSWLSTRSPSKNPGSPVTKKSKTRMFLGKAFMLICSSFTMVLRNEVYNNLDQE